jgi:hypothetical protein
MPAGRNPPPEKGFHRYCKGVFMKEQKIGGWSWGKIS